MTVCAALIVRNEEHFLPACLSSLAGKVDEIVIADTGSTDRSIEIARAHGAKVFHYIWNDDFSGARNAALDHATADWILYIDADEQLSLPQENAVKAYLDERAVGAFVKFRPKTGFTRYRELRLFRRDPRIRFTGVIHETMTGAVEAVAQQDGRLITRTQVMINHFGYDGDQSHKYARNLPLLEAAIAYHPERIFLWLHLAETLMAIGESAKSCAIAREGLARISAASVEKDLAAGTMLRQLLAREALRNGENPSKLIDEGLSLYPDDLALQYLRGCASLENNAPEEALAIAERLLDVDPSVLSDGMLAYDQRLFGQMAAELAGFACLKLGNDADATQYLSRVGVQQAKLAS